MFQIIFNDLSAAEMAALPKLLQLEILGAAELGQRPDGVALARELIFQALALLGAGLVARGVALVAVAVGQVLLEVSLARAQRREDIAVGGRSVRRVSSRFRRPVDCPDNRCALLLV